MNTEQLGWTLIHFLWQGVVIAALYTAVRGLVRQASGRYLLACAALAVMMVAPIVTWCVLGQSDATPVVAADRSARVPASVPAVASLYVAPAPPVAHTQLPIHL